MLSFIKKYFIPQFDIIDTTPNDFEIIKTLFIEGVELGSYEKCILENQEQFETMVSQMTNSKHGQDIHGRIILTFSCAVYEKKTIGFLVLAIDNKNKEVEIWYYSLLKEYRNKGIGTKYFEVLFKMLKREFPDYSLMVRCKQSSKGMTQILRNFNFITSGINKDGYIFYRLNKVF